MNSRPYYLLGDTVRIEGTFKTFAGNVVEVEEPQIIIYDSNWKQIEVIHLAPHNRNVEGVYQKEYVTKQEGTFYLEIWGLVEGTPSLERTTFIVKRV